MDKCSLCNKNIWFWQGRAEENNLQHDQCALEKLNKKVAAEVFKEG